MRGRYYIKHTFNHTMSNLERRKELDNNHKEWLILMAVEHLKTTDEPMDEKVTYLQNYTHDQYRVGRKYKYDCSLNNREISRIIRTAGDEDLFVAYFGYTVHEENTRNVLILIGVILFVIVACSLIGQQP